MNHDTLFLQQKDVWDRVPLPLICMFKHKINMQVRALLWLFKSCKENSSNELIQPAPSEYLENEWDGQNRRGWQCQVLTREWGPRPSPPMRQGTCSHYVALSKDHSRMCVQSHHFPWELCILTVQGRACSRTTLTGKCIENKPRLSSDGSRLRYKGWHAPQSKLRSIVPTCSSTAHPLTPPFSSESRTMAKEVV